MQLITCTCAGRLQRFLHVLHIQPEAARHKRHQTGRKKKHAAEEPGTPVPEPSTHLEELLDELPDVDPGWLRARAGIAQERLQLPLLPPSRLPAALGSCTCSRSNPGFALLPYPGDHERLS